MALEIQQISTAVELQMWMMSQVAVRRSANVVVFLTLF